jgi:hypothetical protein
MARRKKTKKSHSRRRRVSGVALSAKSPLVNYGSIAAGYLMSDKINAALVNVTSSLDPKVVAALQAVGGYLVRKQMKGTAGQALGGVLMGSGLKSGLKAFGVISGLPTVSGYKDLKMIHGVPPMKRVAGVDGMNPSMAVIGQISRDPYQDTDR